MRGVIVAGTALVDRIYTVERYPNRGELAKILDSTRAAGGCVPNVAADLKTLVPELDVTAISRIGRDEDGAFLTGELSRRGVRTEFMKKSDALPTSFTEVMSIRGGERTFFSCPGANAEFGAGDIPFDALDGDRLHLGYLLLLEKVDGGDGEKILREAKRRGLKTSIDLVSDRGASAENVRRCLPFVDDLIVNELEAAMLARRDGNPAELATVLKKMGVIGRVIVHEPKRSVCVSGRGATEVPSLRLPEGYIKGATGAGDAFTAGALVGIGQDMSDEQVLALASCAAAAALGEEDAVSGMKCVRDLNKIMKTYER